MPHLSNNIANNFNILKNLIINDIKLFGYLDQSINLKEFKVYYSPKDIQFNASYTDNSNFTEQRASVGGTITDEKNINLNRDFKTSYSLSDNVLINYQISSRNNLNDFNSKELLNISKILPFSSTPVNSV